MTPIIGNTPTDPNRDEIEPGLWMGGYPLPGELGPEWAVVAVGCLSRSRFHDGPRVEFQMDDEEGAVPSRAILRRLSDCIFAHRVKARPGSPHPVLVHCAAGINRSGLVVGYYLCSRLGYTGEQAIATIREKRRSHGTPMQALCNESFAGALRRWFPGEGRHRWTRYANITACESCGTIRQADGSTDDRPCRGRVHVKPRGGR